MAVSGVAIARLCPAVEQVITVGGASIQLLPADPDRVSVIVLAPPTARVWISSASAAAVGKGVPVPVGSEPLILRAEDWGTWMMRQLRIISEGAGTQDITVISVTTKAG